MAELQGQVEFIFCTFLPTFDFCAANSLKISKINSESLFFVQIAEESCSISPDMFVSNYVMQRKPVVLKVLLIFKNCDVTKCDEYKKECGNVIEQLYITNRSNLPERSFRAA